MASPFPGAWRELSDTHEGFRLFTETHFCYLRTENGRSPISGQPSDEDAAGLFRTMATLAGTHTITTSGDEWIRVRATRLHARPESVGQETKQTWTFDGSRSREQVPQPDGTTLVVNSERVSDGGVSPFAGAWELVSDTYEGLMVRTDSYYAALVTRRNRPLPQAGELSDSDAAALYRATQTAVVGTYTINGMKTTTRTLLDRNPALIGRESTREWRFEDDRSIGVPAGGGEQVVWRRIG